MFQYFIISIFQSYLITCGLILSESGTLGLTGMRPSEGVIGARRCIALLRMYPDKLDVVDAHQLECRGRAIGIVVLCQQEETADALDTEAVVVHDLQGGRHRRG